MSVRLEPKKIKQVNAVCLKSFKKNDFQFSKEKEYRFTKMGLNGDNYAHNITGFFFDRETFFSLFKIASEPKKLHTDEIVKKINYECNTLQGIKNGLKVLQKSKEIHNASNILKLDKSLNNLRESFNDLMFYLEWDFDTDLNIRG